MVRKGMGEPVRRGVAICIIAGALACVAGLAACGGGEDPRFVADVASDSAEIGATIEAEDWRVTLIELPQQIKSLGERVEGGGWWSGYSREGAETAEGIWLICPVELTNEGEEMRILPSKLLKAADAQGREFKMSLLPAHHIAIWTSERWMSEDNQLVQNVIELGVPKEGPIIFDVAPDSTGLRLTAEGVEESIDLGF